MDGRAGYGAAPDSGIEYGGVRFGGGLPDHDGTYAVPKRKRLNGLALLECIVLPWGIFVGVFWLLSFFVHYDHVEATYCLILFALAIPVGFGLKWFFHRNDATFANTELHSWYIYLAAACLVAWLAGVILGDVNYSGNMKKYYDLSSMGLSKDVDPRSVSGNRILDTSRVYFKKGSFIQQDRAMGYKEKSTYCVAPIVFGNQSLVPQAVYSYWAVGVDCCTPMPPSSFWCGSDAFDPEAHAALRWPGDSTNFKHAIEMAEVEYGIKASSPLFFSWMKDPDGETMKYRNAGIHSFHVWVWLYLAFQIVCFCGVATFYWRRYMSVVGKRP